MAAALRGLGAGGELRVTLPGLLRLVAPCLLCAGLGFGAAWSWQGSRGEARLLALENRYRQEKLDQAAALRREVERRQALADEIARRAAAREQALTIKLEETHHALKTATRGRPCLGGAALRVLDQSTGLRPPAAAGPSDGRAAAAAADPADEEASDGDVAGWIAIAGDYYERCRERLRAIRQFAEGGR